MRVIALVLACSFLKGSAIPNVQDESLNALKTLLLAQQSLHAPRAVARERPETAREALRLRGGSDLVDAETVTKVLTAIMTMTGLQCTISPKSTYETYGIEVSKKKKDKKSNDILDFVMENNGLATLSSAAVVWSMISGADPMKAIGYGYVPYVLSGLKNIKDKRATKVGMPEWTQKFFVALNGFFAYSFLTGQAYCPTLSKIAAGWSMFNGLFGALLPKKFSANWGLTGMNAKSEALMKHFGYQLIAFGLLSGSLAQGTELTKALGYSWATYLAAGIDGKFISKTFADQKNGPMYTWLLLEAAATAKFLS
jgi:hypothetical protein